MLDRVVLDDRAAIYLQAHLSGVNAFCSLLLEQVIGDAGEIFTLAPKGTPRDRLYQFETGGLSGHEKVIDSMRLFAERVMPHFA